MAGILRPANRWAPEEENAGTQVTSLILRVRLRAAEGTTSGGSEQRLSWQGRGSDVAGRPKTARELREQRVGVVNMDKLFNCPVVVVYLLCSQLPFWKSGRGCGWMPR